MGPLFVTGATGFIGSALVRRAVTGGTRVQALVRSDRAAREARDLGAEPVHGDLAEDGAWQNVASRAEMILHLAQPKAFGARVTSARARAYETARIAMDRRILDAARGVRRLLYVAGTSYYGNLGAGTRDEQASPVPRGWGRYIARAVEEASERARTGLPIVLAFPGYVYGDGSWFRDYVLEALRKRKPIHVLSGGHRRASPVHVDDCAAALLHLAEHGEVGARYFVVDDEPIFWLDFYSRAARALGEELRLRPVPTPFMRVLIGDLLTEALLTDAALSNARLRATGFVPRFPSSRDGLVDVARSARTSGAPGARR